MSFACFTKVIKYIGPSVLMSWWHTYSSLLAKQRVEPARLISFKFSSPIICHIIDQLGASKFICALIVDILIKMYSVYKLYNQRGCSVSKRSNSQGWAKSVLLLFHQSLNQNHATNWPSEITNWMSAKLFTMRPLCTTRMQTNKQSSSYAQ